MKMNCETYLHRMYCIWKRDMRIQIIKPGLKIYVREGGPVTLYSAIIVSLPHDHV